MFHLFTFIIFTINVFILYRREYYYDRFPLYIIEYPFSGKTYTVKIGHKKRVIVITYGEFKKSNTQTWCIILLLLYTLHIHNTIYILSPIFHGL